MKQIKLLLFLFFAIVYQAFSQTTIKGKVVDQNSNAPLEGVVISTEDQSSGAVTGADGSYSFETTLTPPFKLLYNFVGYDTLKVNYTGPETNLNVGLASTSVIGPTAVITASRVQESILKAPVAIEKLDSRAIKETPSPTFYDALEHVKGVQMTTSSITFKVPNTRGFNSPNNFRFMQVVDGVDMQAAALGVPLGNTIGPNELDIESVEITPGAASALYGMNAINGMANMITKNPWNHQGFSFYQRAGINHVGEKFTAGGKTYSNTPLSETAFRYAQAFNDKFAFKINGSYFVGTDWISNTTTDQNPQNLSTANPAFPPLFT